MQFLLIHYSRIIFFGLVQPWFFARNIKGKEHQDYRQCIQQQTDNDITENFLPGFFWQLHDNRIYYYKDFLTNQSVTRIIISGTAVTIIPTAIFLTSMTKSCPFIKFILWVKLEYCLHGEFFF